MARCLDCVAAPPRPKSTTIGDAIVRTPLGRLLALAAQLDADDPERAERLRSILSPGPIVTDDEGERRIAVAVGTEECLRWEELMATAGSEEEREIIANAVNRTYTPTRGWTRRSRRSNSYVTSESCRCSRRSGSCGAVAPAPARLTVVLRVDVAARGARGREAVLTTTLTLHQ